MIAWEKLSKDEFTKISKIVNRALRDENITADSMDLSMDISAAHIDCPMDLDGLLGSDKFTFTHDVRGIMRNINRKTGKIDNFFVPRCSA